MSFCVYECLMIIPDGFADVLGLFWHIIEQHLYSSVLSSN
jgi:hypothetical protein